MGPLYLDVYKSYEKKVNFYLLYNCSFKAFLSVGDISSFCQLTKSNYFLSAKTLMSAKPFKLHLPNNLFTGMMLL